MKKLKQLLPISNEIISVQELKLLVASIIHQKAKIRIKCLTDGGVWTTQFFSVMMVTDKGLVLNDEATDKIKSIRFIDQVIQFVLDTPFNNYNSNLAYLVH
ncbi:MAG TPA: hypothetical protein VGK59_18485 [Ohtaekwangia sp.]